MINTKNTFTFVIPTTRTSNEIRNEISEWIKEKNILTQLEAVYEDENQVHLKHPVHVVTSFISVRWTPKPMVIYYLKFIVKDTQLGIEAEIEHIRKKDDKLERLFWRFKCRNFLLGFFKRIKLDKDPQLLYTLYPREELRIYLEELWRSFLKTMLFYHAILTIITLLISRRFDDVIQTNLAVLILDFFMWIFYRMDTRRYRKYFGSL